MTGADHLVDILKDLLEEAGRDPASVAVLDVAAGTGIAGEGLARAGFNNITALDFSPEMLKVAEKKGAKIALASFVKSFAASTPIYSPQACTKD